MKQQEKGFDEGNTKAHEEEAGDDQMNSNKGAEDQLDDKYRSGISNPKSQTSEFELHDLTQPDQSWKNLIEEDEDLLRGKLENDNTPEDRSNEEKESDIGWI